MAKKNTKTSGLRTRTVQPVTRDPGYFCPNCGKADSMRETGREERIVRFSCSNCGHNQIRII